MYQPATPAQDAAFEDGYQAHRHGLPIWSNNRLAQDTAIAWQRGYALSEDHMNDEANA